MANYPQVLAQDAVCQNHTGHMTRLWFLPTRPLRMNTNERMNLKKAQFSKKFTEYKMCVSGFSTKFVWNIFPKIYIGLHVKYPIFMSGFHETWIFSIEFRKKKFHKYQISWKSVLWKPNCSMRTDRHDEANSRFSQFLRTRPKNHSDCKLGWSTGEMGF